MKWKDLLNKYGDTSKVIDKEYKSTYNKSLKAGQDEAIKQNTDVGINTVENYRDTYGGNNFSLDNGNSYYTKTDNGFIKTDPANPNYNMFDAIDNEKEGFAQIARQKVIDNAQKRLAILTNPIRKLSKEDQIEINQLQLQLQNPDDVAVMARLGYNPKDLQTNEQIDTNNITEPKKKDIYTKVNKIFSHLDQINDQFPLGDEQSKTGVVYLLKNPTTGDIKIGYAKNTEEARYKYQDVKDQGWQLAKEYRVPNAVKYEQDIHRLLRKAGIRPFNKAFGSGYTEVYHLPELTKEPENKEAYQQYQALQQAKSMDYQTNLAQKAQVYDGYWSELADSFQAGAIRYGAGALAGGFRLARNVLNSTVNPDDDQMHESWIESELDKASQNANEIAGYNPKDEIQASKDIDTGIAEIKNGRVLKGLIDVLKSGKAVPTILAGSAAEMGAFMLGGPEMLTAKSLLSITPSVLNQYNRDMNEYIKNNNGKAPSGQAQLGMLSVSLADQLIQKGALEFLLDKNPAKGITKVLLKIPGKNGDIIGNIDTLAKVVPPKYMKPIVKNLVVKTLAKSMKVGSKGLLTSITKGALPEGVAEFIDQMTDDVLSQYNTDKYKDKSLFDIIQSNLYDASKAGILGAMSGGMLRSPVDIANATHEEYKKSVQDNFNRFNQDMLDTIAYMPEETKNNIRPQVEQQVNDKHNEVNNISDIHNSGSIDEMFNENNTKHIKEMDNVNTDPENNNIHEDVSNTLYSIKDTINKSAPKKVSEQLNKQIDETLVNTKDKSSDEVVTHLNEIKNTIQSNKHIKDKKVLTNKIDNTILNVKKKDIDNKIQSIKLDKVTDSEQVSNIHEKVNNTLTDVKNNINNNEFIPKEEAKNLNTQINEVIANIKDKSSNEIITHLKNIKKTIQTNSNIKSKKELLNKIDDTINSINNKDKIDTLKDTLKKDKNIPDSIKAKLYDYIDNKANEVNEVSNNVTTKLNEIKNNYATNKLSIDETKTKLNELKTEVDNNTKLSDNTKVTIKNHIDNQIDNLDKTKIDNDFKQKLFNEKLQNNETLNSALATIDSKIKEIKSKSSSEPSNTNVEPDNITQTNEQVNQTTTQQQKQQTINTNIYDRIKDTINAINSLGSGHENDKANLKQLLYSNVKKVLKDVHAAESTQLQVLHTIHLALDNEGTKNLPITKRILFKDKKFSYNKTEKPTDNKHLKEFTPEELKQTSNEIIQHAQAIQNEINKINNDPNIDKHTKNELTKHYQSQLNHLTKLHSYINSREQILGHLGLIKTNPSNPNNNPTNPSNPTNRAYYNNTNEPYNNNNSNPNPNNPNNPNPTYDNYTDIPSADNNQDIDESDVSNERTLASVIYVSLKESIDNGKLNYENLVNSIHSFYKTNEKQLSNIATSGNLSNKDLYLANISIAYSISKYINKNILSSYYTDSNIINLIHNKIEGMLIDTFNTYYSDKIPNNINGVDNIIDYIMNDIMKGCK